MSATSTYSDCDAQNRNHIFDFSDNKIVSYLRLRGRYSLFKFIFGGVIIVLANKSITTRSFILLSVSVMI